MRSENNINNLICKDPARKKCSHSDYIICCANCNRLDECLVEEKVEVCDLVIYDDITDVKECFTDSNYD